MITIRLIDARRGLSCKCRELFGNERIADEIYRYLCDGLEECESVEPERKKGEWIKGGEQPYFKKHFDIVVCSICNKRGEHRWNFCPNCGADMRGEQDE